MKTKREVISKSSKRRNVPKGSNNFTFTEMVVYKTKVGKKKNGKPKYESVTRHESV